MSAKKLCVCVCVNTRNLLSCGPFLLCIYLFFDRIFRVRGITYSIKITMSVESSHKTWKVNIGLPLLNPQQWTSTVCAIHSSKCQHSLKETWITKVKGIVNHLNNFLSPAEHKRIYLFQWKSMGSISFKLQKGHKGNIKVLQPTEFHCMKNNWDILQTSYFMFSRRKKEV